MSISVNFAIHNIYDINTAKKIFVTGGTGFLGAYIIRQLVAQGYQVRALRRGNQIPFFIPANVFSTVEWVAGDILDTAVLEDAMEGIDAVIHSAAKVSFVSTDHRQMLKINIEGTANIVNAALVKRVPRLVHVSSVAAFGRTMNGETVTENKQWEDSKINTTYAISKYNAEMEVWRGIGEGLNAVIVNPSTILGYGNWNNSSCAIFKTAYDEFPWYSNGVNGFVDVEDVARAVVLLMETDITNQRFILNGDNWSFRQVFTAMANAFGKKPPFREATPALASLAWRLEKVKSFFSGQPSLLTKESARVARTSTYFDNKKIGTAIPGFRFTPLDECVKNACNLYLQHL